MGLRRPGGNGRQNEELPQNEKLRDIVTRLAVVTETGTSFYQVFTRSY